jgi:hypothetical protein
MNPPTRSGSPPQAAATRLTSHLIADQPQTTAQLVAWADLDPAALGALLMTLPADDPLVIVARAAVEAREGRQQIRQASHAISTAADWRLLGARHVSHAELVRRRAEIGGAA